jgi:hypothetical protein
MQWHQGAAASELLILLHHHPKQGLLLFPPAATAITQHRCLLLSQLRTAPLPLVHATHIWADVG